MTRISDPAPATPAAGNGRHPEFLEIDTARKRRWLGVAGYGLFFLAIAVVLLIVFVKFSGSLAMGLFLVLFMIAYMTIMGHVAEGKLDRRE